MDIYHVFGSLDRGGAETLVWNLSKSMSENIEFNYIVHGKYKGTYEEELEANGSVIYHLPSFRIYNIINYIIAANRLFRTFKTNSIVHIHMRSTSGILAYIARKNRLKTIIHSHSNSNGKGLKSKIVDLIQSNGTNTSKRLSCSIESGVWMFQDNSFEFFPNAINVGKYLYDESSRTSIRKQLNLDENTYLIGHVGNYIPAKNHNFIIDLIEKLEKEKDIVFILLGNNVTADPIAKKLVRQVKRKKVILMESVSNVNEYYSAMDLLVLPSVREGFPMVLIEAQANGLQILMSDKVTEEVKILNKIVELPLDAKVWISSILQLKKVKNNRKLSCSELEIINSFDVSTAARKLEEIYLDVMNT